MNRVGSQKPIGVFDSGVGGLSVAREIFRKLPNEQIIYFGDTAHVPYGPRSQSELIHFGNQITDFLINQGVKMIIIACNTSSSLSFESLKEKYNLPFVDVINPSIDVAIKNSTKQKIGVIATEATIKTGAHKKLLLAENPNVEVFTSACPKFVPLVEQGTVEGKEVEKIIYEYLAPLMEKEIDTLILGCTHYPFLEKSIKKVLGKDIKIIDPAQETVVMAKTSLQRLNLLNLHPNKDNEYWVSGDPDSFYKNAQNFIQDNIKKVNQVTL